MKETMNIKLLNWVYYGIKSGKLEHNQSDFHCGTAHCIAGWIEMKYTKKGYYDKEGIWQGVERKNPVLEGSSTEYFAKQKLQVTSDEAIMMFHGDIDPFITIERLRAGYRYVGPSLGRVAGTRYLTHQAEQDKYWSWDADWWVSCNHLYIPVKRKCNMNTMMTKIKRLGFISYEPYMDKTIFPRTIEFNRCITAELK